MREEIAPNYSGTRTNYFKRFKMLARPAAADGIVPARGAVKGQIQPANQNKRKDVLRVAGSHETHRRWPCRGGGICQGITFTTVVSNGGVPGAVTSRFALTV